MQRILRTGGTVRVIALTVGDGYLEAAAALSGHPQPSQADYRALGAARAQELRNAASILGVRDLILLGRPDDGLQALWRTPQFPYVSPTTGNGPFTGQTLLRDLRTSIAAVLPTLVVVPDPRDHHPDHAAAGRFAIAAAEGLPSRPMVLGYLVHDATWPPPRQNADVMPVPGRAYADTRWLSFALRPDEITKKREALLAHGTQWRLMRGLLERFVRDNEVFAVWPEG